MLKYVPFVLISIVPSPAKSTNNPALAAVPPNEYDPTANAIPLVVPPEPPVPSAPRISV